MGAALLDLDEPWKVIARSRDYLLSPQVPYEQVGDVQNVVFPCAALVDQATDRLTIYYGAADTVTCLAHGHLSEIVAFAALLTLHGLHRPEPSRFRPGAGRMNAWVIASCANSRRWSSRVTASRPMPSLSTAIVVSCGVTKAGQVDVVVADDGQRRRDLDMPARPGAQDHPDRDIVVTAERGPSPPGARRCTGCPRPRPPRAERGDLDVSRPEPTSAIACS